MHQKQSTICWSIKQFCKNDTVPTKLVVWKIDFEKWKVQWRRAMQCTMTLRKRVHTKPASNLTPVVLQTQHNCHARQLNLRKYDTSNCKRRAASHQECEASEPAPCQLRATNRKTLCGLTALQKLPLCKLQTPHSTTLLRRLCIATHIKNSFANIKCELRKTTIRKQ